jgi:predicted DNA-binding transcriptional regulator AlpA
MSDPMFVSIEKMKDLTGISRSEIYRAFGNGKLPFSVIAGRIRFSDLKAYLSRGG